MFMHQAPRFNFILCAPAKSPPPPPPPPPFRLSWGKHCSVAYKVFVEVHPYMLLYIIATRMKGTKVLTLGAGR